jgi:hypothetical protein
MSTANQDIKPIMPRSQRLINTEIFDDEYYSAEAGKVFDSKQAAASHFVQFGMKGGLSFHPLFDLGMFPSDLRDSYKAGDIDALLTYLRSEESRTHAWSSLFDPAQVEGVDAAGSLLLSRFRRGRTVALTVPERFIGTPPEWSEARDMLLDHARTVKSYELAKKALRLKTWSTEAELSWIESIRGVDVADSADVAPVSIVMPVWNREHSVGTAIDSVRSQTFTAWELLVVDDGSSDRTREIVRAYSVIDPRVRLIEADHRGVSAARNTGIDAAAGEYLAFLDSDNTWRPDFLNNMWAGMRMNGSRAAYAAIRMLNGRGEYLGQTVTATQLLLRNFVDLNVLVAETSLIRDLGGFDTALRRWVDYDLVLRIVEISDIEYFPFIGCDYVDDDSDDRITRRESENWQYAVLGKNVERRLAPSAPSTEKPKPALSIVVRVTENINHAVVNIRRLCESVADKAVQVVVVDDLLGFRHSLRLRAAVAGLPAADYVKLPRRYTDAIALNVGAGRARGANIAFVKHSVEFRGDAVDRLVQRLEDPNLAAVQPLVTDPTGVVVSAGSVGQRNSLAVPLFRGLNIADAQQHTGEDVDELASSVFVVRAATFEALGGFSDIFVGEAAIVDFFRRLTALPEGKLATESFAVAVDHSADSASVPAALSPADLPWLASVSGASQRTLKSHYRDVGLEVIGLQVPSQPTLQPASPIVTRHVGRKGTASRPSLRWAIKICADFNRGGDRWGDVPYAADLAAALAARGQEVVVDRTRAATRVSNHLDDVVVVIRGLHPCEPQAGKTNILWAISRPDLITREELLGFDAVFGASRTWCDFVSGEWGIEAKYLPQATNPERFHPELSRDSDLKYGLTFVGGPRKPIGRKIVTDCIETGREVSVWGPRWAQFVPPEMVVSDFIDNDSLVSVYAASKIVLNDHFEDMAAWGFANNRLYDAVASGARVISDEVEGVQEIFKGAVQTYSSLEELDRILADTSVFPDDAEMKAISQMVREEHNFGNRADVLLTTALDHRAGKAAG